MIQALSLLLPLHIDLFHLPSVLQYHFHFAVSHGLIREPATAFLDIRHIDERGATAQGLFELWNEVADDYEFDVSKHLAIACYGAAALDAGTR